MKVDESIIVGKIQEYKVNFALEKETFDVLSRAGATDITFKAIRENPFAPLFFTFPYNGDRVSAYVSVEGWSKSVSGKHLWLFVHAKGERDWIPQCDEVLPDTNGTWKHSVFFGRPRDPRGASFEVKAVWVNSQAHDDLVKYFQLDCRLISNKCPDDCPGIRLPAGSPAAELMVLR